MVRPTDNFIAVSQKYHKNTERQNSPSITFKLAITYNHSQNMCRSVGGAPSSVVETVSSKLTKGTVDQFAESIQLFVRRVILKPATISPVESTRYSFTL